MRTTLTVEPAVAERINRVVTTQGRSMKDVVNEALRKGLKRTLSRRPDTLITFQDLSVPGASLEDKP